MIEKPRNLKIVQILNTKLFPGKQYIKLDIVQILKVQLQALLAKQIGCIYFYLKGVKTFYNLAKPRFSWNTVFCVVFGVIPTT